MRILAMVLCLIPLAAAAQPKAFVWANEPSSASYTPSAQLAYNSSGGAVTITRASTGAYNVTFAGLARGGGKVQAAVYGEGGNTCKIAKWSFGNDLTASVHCRANDAFADARFMLLLSWTDVSGKTKAASLVPNVVHAADQQPVAIPIGAPQAVLPDPPGGRQTWLDKHAADLLAIMQLILDKDSLDEYLANEPRDLTPYDRVSRRSEVISVLVKEPEP